MLLQRPEDQALATARATTKRVARTFALACRLLPRALRDDVYRLYLVFRTLDDLVDEGDPRAAARLAAVEAWCAGAAPRSPEAHALDDLGRRHPLPPAAIVDFCAGMRDDLRGPSIATERELDVYCHRVAGTVGVVMAAVFGATDVAAPRHADALGQAMQRTNILRDIDEDLANGRVYLARETLERHGLRAVPPPSRREALLRDQIARADALYEEGIAGIALLPHGRASITAAAAMYREILRQIEREGYGMVAGRAVVPRPRKLLVATRAQAAVRRA